MTEETIDDVKQAYALLFKAHGAVVEERDALAGRVAELEAAAQPFVKLFQQADANRDQPMDGRSNIDAQIAVKDLRRLAYAVALSTTPESKP